MGSRRYTRAKAEESLATDDNHPCDGVVTKKSNGIYFVESEYGHMVQARLKGKMGINRINVVPGDRVKLLISPSDPTRGFITYRYKDSR